MPSLLRLISTCLFVGEGLAQVAALEKRANVILPAPIVGVPSQHWDGTAGNWSSFEIHAGTSTNNAYRVMPATSWQETWVIFGNDQDRYCNVSLGVPKDCAESRGGVFQNTTSTTWNASFPLSLKTNQLILGLDEPLGENGEGIYGFDVVGFGFAEGQGPTLNNSILAEIVSNTWWLGIFGMGFQPTNFSGFGDPYPSFAENLFTQGMIASRTWSYTAGAFYRLKGVFGSMIFGGYDASLFVPNDVRFSMASDVTRDIVLSIHQIVSTTASGNITLMSTPDLFFIDSAVPELWLPVDVCKQFEKAFGITLDPVWDLYLVNDSTHSKLLHMNPNITFTLADQNNGGSTVNITLPYAAFDHNITAPFYNGTSRWFPLMQAGDSSQNTLGRTFLQEAYVTANYESRTFNVSQTVFHDGSVPSDIIPIPGTASSSTQTAGSTTTSSKKLSGGDIAGIVISAVAVLAIVGSILACWLSGIFCFRSRKKEEESHLPIHEVGGRGRADSKSSANPSHASGGLSEVSGHDAKVEIMGNPIMQPQELEAEVPLYHGPLSPVAEKPTPVAELGVQEGGLGYGMTTSIGEENVRGENNSEDDPVSPNSPTWARDNRAHMSMTSPVVSSPSEATWMACSPTSPVQRKGTSGSRFRESFDI